jgi:oxygen-independent coproporphyrinogen-3 oxidase
VSRLPLADASVIDLRADAIPHAGIDALYVHVPFCFHKCHYCDFYSITRQTPERMERFVDRLLTEAGYWRSRDVQPKTVFFGGGTPSLLPLDEMRRLIAGLHDCFNLSVVNEWTVEVNPATADLDYCRMLRSLGVDRLSFGAQSFNRAELAALERHHDPDDVVRSIAIARDAGFDRLNVDLIYAIPDQTLDSWKRSLAAAIDLRTGHVSAYGLTYEPNTVIAVKKRLGQLDPAEESLELAMFDAARSVLGAAGIDWYEISNYAAAGDECRHNLVYWTGGNYVGLGPSAASHVAGHRFKNRPHLGDWEAAVPGGHLPVIEHEILPPPQRMLERLMFQLRLRRGITFDELSDYGDDARARFADTFEHLRTLGLLRGTDSDGMRLTDIGLHVADAVAAEFARCDPSSSSPAGRG